MNSHTNSLIHRETPRDPGGLRPIAITEPVSNFWRAPPNSGSFLGLFPAAGCAKPSSSFVMFQQRAMQAWTLFMVSIDRGTSSRVNHRRPWLTDTSQFGGAPCWLLARPGCGTRRCRRTDACKFTAQWLWAFAVEYHLQKANTFIRSPTDRRSMVSRCGRRRRSSGGCLWLPTTISSSGYWRFRQD
jgi:hypothetical protein